MERYAPASVNKMLSALRGTLRQAFRLELIDAQNYARAVDVQNIKAIRGLRGRALNQSEIAALMEVCFNDVSSKGARDAALIAMNAGVWFEAL
jgi:hydroxypyruvate isomerase